MLAVIGGRDFKDYDLMCQVLDKMDFKKIVSGGARGADLLAERYCKENQIDNIIYRPNWDIIAGGKSNYQRNVFMIHEAHEVVAFWDGSSAGTKHCIDLALKKGIPLTVINYTISF